MNLHSRHLILAAAASLAVASLSHAAAFTAGNLVVYRVGTGSGALSNAATAVFLDEYTPTGTLVQSVALPTTTSGSTNALTASGTATSEGLLTRSADGRFLVATGYAAASGTAGVVALASTTAPRVIGRIDGGGASNTSTTTTAFSANNIRSATSFDGSGFWASGANTGVMYQTFGSTGAGTTVSNTFTNTRQITIANNQLYLSSGSSTLRLGTVGSGTPTTTGQTTTNLPGLPTSGAPSAYSFFFADLDVGVAGVDTVYVADDTATTGGIQKYSFNGTTWTARGTVVTASVRGLTGSVSPTGAVTLFTTSGASSTLLGTLTDSSGSTGTLTGSVSNIATAGTNTALRGIAFAADNSNFTTANSTTIAFGKVLKGAAASQNLTFTNTGDTLSRVALANTGSASSSVGAGDVGLNGTKLVTVGLSTATSGSTSGSVNVSGTSSLDTTEAINLSATVVTGSQGSVTSSTTLLGSFNELTGSQPVTLSSFITALAGMDGALLTAGLDLDSITPLSGETSVIGLGGTLFTDLAAGSSADLLASVNTNIAPGTYSAVYRLAFSDANNVVGGSAAGSQAIDVTLITVVNSAVPEPASIALIGLGGAAFLARRRRAV